MPTRHQKLRSLLGAAALLLCAGGLSACRRASDPASASPAASPAGSQTAEGQATAAFLRLEARERAAAQSVWAPELLAQECSRTFEHLWDQVKAASNKLEALAAFEFGQIILPQWNVSRPAAHGILLWDPQHTASTTTIPTSPATDAAAAAATPATVEEARERLRELAAQGWSLVQLEFRHTRFETNATGQPAASRYDFSSHWLQPATEGRAIVEGTLVIDWGAPDPSTGLIRVRQIDASQLALRTRFGPPPFQPWLDETIAPPENSRVIDPLLVHDLDGDGTSEIVLVAKNLVYQAIEGTYRPQALCRFPLSHISAAVLGDFNGDGATDLLCDRYEGLYLFAGSGQPVLATPARQVWSVRPPILFSTVLTAGDADQDGDLDVFLAQYKEPYDGGATPAPFFDANDGHPSYLLLNDGQGNFSDGTVAAGLADRRHRRTYSASFVQLDSDANLDLMVVSDFAGLDLYRNDGTGRFARQTGGWIDEPMAFGMAHAVNDFNSDGLMDLLMIGMTSPTVERLDHLQLWRSPDPSERHRTPMTRGNRLYLGQPGGRFVEGELSQQVARSGWSWGCGALDFDNDSFVDLAIVNGLESHRSVRDYEAEYWLHDQFVSSPTNTAAGRLYFSSKFARTRGTDHSYGGYEKNRFFVNQQGRSFLEAGHLFDLALELDSRNLVAGDLDGDGRQDLVLTTLEIWPRPRQSLRVYRNVLPHPGHWIAFQILPAPGAPSVFGTRVTVRAGSQTWIRQLINGDSHRSQHALSLHFGLGSRETVDEAEIQFPSGPSVRLANPAINRSHRVAPSVKK